VTFKVSFIGYIICEVIYIFDKFQSTQISYRDWEHLAGREGLFLGILKVCGLYMIEKGIQYAVNGLDDLALGPSRKIQLAIEYSLTDFVYPAVVQLVDKPLRDFTEYEIEQLGSKVYHIITKAKEAIEKEARLVAAFPPPFVATASPPTSECPNHQQCISIWKKVWWNVIARSILHPFRPTSISARSMNDLILATEFPGMMPNCKSTVIQHLIDNNFFCAQEAYLQKAQAAIIDMFNPNHIPFPRPPPPPQSPQN
jgi:hypothetical protein